MTYKYRYIFFSQMLFHYQKALLTLSVDMDTFILIIDSVFFSLENIGTLILNTNKSSSQSMRFSPTSTFPLASK
jgi:hypothetical protein